MRRVLTILLLALCPLCFQGSPQQSQQTSANTTATIEGLVVRADTGTPVSGAQVQILAAPVTPGGIAPAVLAATQPAPTPPRPIPPVATDSNGKFTVKELLAGGYRIAVTADGFVRQEYGGRAGAGQGRSVFVTAGQTLKDTTIRLTPTGTVSGRVFDENARPATGAPVALIRAAYSAQGRNLQSVGAAAVDDRGEYRVYGVPPGRYYLLAGTPPGLALALRSAGGVGGGLLSTGSARFGMVYYPNAPEIEQATQIEVKAGMESSIDMRLRRQTQTFRVRGRAVDATSSGLPPNLNVALAYRFLSGTGTIGTQRTFDATTGTFELQNVYPGEYFIQAQVPNQVPFEAGPVDQAGLAARQAAQATRPYGHVPIKVVDADVEGVVLTVTTGISTTGRFVLEGQPIASLPNLNQMRLGLQPAAMLINTGAPVGFPPAQDGTFEVVGLKAGEYRTQVAPLGLIPTYYLKSITYGGDDILNKPFKFSGTSAGTFEIVMRAGASQVSGTVTDARTDPAAGVPVLLIPQQRSRTDLLKMATTDQNGRFTIVGVAPGAYKLFSWESIENGAQYNPDFLKEHEERGRLLQVAESSMPNVDLKVIPIP